jgi:hypothetical protein
MSTRMAGRGIGVWSAGAVVAIVAAYLVTGFVWLFSGGWTSPQLFRPPDPFLAILEVLLLLSAAALVVVMAAVHANAPADRKAFSLAALAFTIIFATLTSGVHFVWLTVLRQTPSEAVPPTLRPDPWPSTLTALDMLAWGPALGLSFLAAAPVFTGGKLQRAICIALTVGGTLSVAGTLGPALGDLRFWLLATADYALVLPVICSLLVFHFHALKGDSPTAAERPGRGPAV